MGLTRGKQKLPTIRVFANGKNSVEGRVVCSTYHKYAETEPVIVFNEVLILVYTKGESERESKVGRCPQGKGK